MPVTGNCTHVCTLSILALSNEVAQRAAKDYDVYILIK